MSEDKICPPRTPGTRDVFPSSVPELVERVRRVADKPLAVGFGILTPEHTSAVARITDGVIVGSTVGQRCAESASSIKTFISSLREAMTRESA